MAKKAKKPVMLVVASKIKALAKEKGYRIGGDALARLSIKVEDVLNDATTSAQGEKRMTIKDRDIS
jgi:histone H3/H4